MKIKVNSFFRVFDIIMFETSRTSTSILDTHGYCVEKFLIERICSCHFCLSTDPRILQVEIDRLNELVENLHVQIRDLEMEMLSLRMNFLQRKNSFFLSSFFFLFFLFNDAVVVGFFLSTFCEFFKTLAGVDGCVDALFLLFVFCR